jgi:hemoglobin/transferrin/lactoferrin receptor protein
VPTFASPGSRTFHGSFNARAANGDRSAGANATLGYAGRNFGLFTNGAVRGVGEFRPGKGVDSHAAITRFFGLKSTDLMDSRLPDTSWSQMSGLVKFNWAPTANDQVVASYARSQQSNGKRYDQLLGGDGNLIADLGPDLDLGYAVQPGRPRRLRSLRSPLVQCSAGADQPGRQQHPRASITHEPRDDGPRVPGACDETVWTRQNLVIGGDYYRSTSTRRRMPSPGDGRGERARRRVPDGARKGMARCGNDRSCRTSSSSSATCATAARRRLEASDSPLVNGQPLWPDDSATASALAFRAGVVGTPSERWSVSGNISRGFRAPHVTDLGTVGLTGSGYQVSATAVEGMGATVGSTAGASAVSTGRPVEH